MLPGPLDAVAARELRLIGISGFAVPLVRIIDAMSVFAAVTATFTEIQAEESFSCHAQFLRELLDQLVLHVLIWFDACDMCADGCTKGVQYRRCNIAPRRGSCSGW